MQAKFEKLSNDMQLEIARHLDAPDFLNLALASKKNWEFFKPCFGIRQLLQQVILCNHNAVAKILNNNIRLLFQKGRITDCSGRTFTNISAFEYTLWALDRHLWTTMLACLPKNENGKAVVKQLLAQLNNLEKSGVTYVFQGNIVIESHYDFAIINALQAHVNLVSTPGENWDSRSEQWRKEVGGAQKNLPMHIVDEYCSEVPFYPRPDFILRPTSSREFCYDKTGSLAKWFCRDSKLGIDFAIFKGSWNEAERREHCTRRVVGDRELAAMTALYKARTKDFIELKSQLEKELVVNSCSQVVQI